MGMEHAALACVLGLILMWMSRNQPFPEVSRRFGIILLMLGFLGLLSESAPRPTTDRVWLITYTGLGGLGVVIGMRHMTHTRMDVLIAPASGFLLCIGVIGLLWNEWRVLSEFEQIASFLLASFLCMGEVYLVFRGLLIGKLPQSWSQAGLRSLQRGILDGPNGAIFCFERAWDVEKEHLNPMAYLALQRIFYARGDSVNADEWALKLAENGGKNAVDEAWIKAVDDSLKRLGMDFEQEE